MSKYVPHLPIIEGRARQMTAGVKDQISKYRIIEDWLKSNIAYDFVKAAKVAKVKGVMPDPIACWETRLGICQDIASLATIMFRAVGIKAYMCIGHADQTYHAWVQSYINGQVHRYDHSGKAKVYRLERKY